MRRRKLWRESVGQKGVNRVTVYEKRPGSQLYVEWWDDRGRNQKAIGSLIGEPVTDKELALDVAHEMAEAQRQKRNQAARRLIKGYSPEATVGTLLAQLHEDKWKDWSESYRRDQVRFRAFWEEHLGKSTPLVNVNPAAVNRIVREVAGKRDWSAGTQHRYLRYLVDAYYYGQRQLKLIGEAHNLSAVRFPKRRTVSRSYTMDEVVKLVRALEEVDERAGFVGHVAWQTGRRLNAIRMLTRGDVEVRSDDLAVITFPGSTDKARNSGEAALAGRAVTLLRALLLHGRRYLVSEESGEPVSRERLIKEWLPAAEGKAGIPHVDGRAYHGIKRRWATRTRGMEARDKQGGTLEATLDTHYVQDDIEPKIKLARRLADEVEEG
jgi:integrase